MSNFSNNKFDKMKRLTTYKLMQILLKEDARSEYPAYKINKLEDAILSKRISFDIDSYSLDEMEMEYTGFVKVSRTKIEIKDIRGFIQRLDIRLRYAEDRELEKIVVEAWRTL